MVKATKEATEKKTPFIEERVAELLPYFDELSSLPSRTSSKAKEDGYYKVREKLKTGKYKTTKVKLKDSNGNEVIGWKNKVIQEHEIFLSRYTPVSACSRVVDLRNKLVASVPEYIEVENRRKVKRLIANYCDEMQRFFRISKFEYSEAYRKKVSERNEGSNKEELDLTEYLKQAGYILSEVHNSLGTDKRPIDWKDVSCAIALVTGRRMGEIHLSGIALATDDNPYLKGNGELTPKLFYEPIEGHQIIFTGQLKGKKRKNRILYDPGYSEYQRYPDECELIKTQFYIPTLVRAEYVESAFDYLEQCGKRFAPDEDTSRVNNTYSKVLSKAVKQNWDFMGEGNTTYHKLRAAYFTAAKKALEFYSDDEDSKVGPMIMGDDPSALRSYARFRIKEGTTVIIKD